MKYSQTCIQMPLMTREPEIAAFMNSCPWYAGYAFYAIFINEKMRLPFIDSDLLYRDALYGMLDCNLWWVQIYIINQMYKYHCVNK